MHRYTLPHIHFFYELKQCDVMHGRQPQQQQNYRIFTVEANWIKIKIDCSELCWIFNLCTVLSSDQLFF